MNRPVQHCLTSVRCLAVALVVAMHSAFAVSYRVEIDAPKDLKSRLDKGLNIVRWRLDPEMNAERLKRLVDEAVRESREAAATEGYFKAEVTSGRSWSSLMGLAR